MTAAHEQIVQITNKRGLHARAAAKFVKLVEQHKADVKVLKDDMEVCGSSIMGLLMLSASKNSAIKITVKGENAKTVLDDLVSLVQHRFGEEE